MLGNSAPQHELEVAGSGPFNWRLSCDNSPGPSLLHNYSEAPWERVPDLELACNEMPATVAPLRSSDIQSPDSVPAQPEPSMTLMSSGHILPQYTLPANCTSSRQFDMDSFPMIPLVESIDLGSRSYSMRTRRTARRTNPTAYPSLTPEMNNPGLHSSSDFPEFASSLPGQSDTSATIPSSEMRVRQLATTHSESRAWTTSPLMNRAQPRQSSVVTFYCRKPIRCENHCRCVCHSKYHYKSPGLVQKLLGSLFIGYTGLPILAARCNLDTCVNQISRSIRATYSFPTWFVSKSLDVIVQSSSTLYFGLNVRNRILLGSGMNILSLCSRGDTRGVMKLLEKHEASLNDIELTHGTSALYVYIPFPNYNSFLFTEVPPNP